MCFWKTMEKPLKNPRCSRISQEKPLKNPLVPCVLMCFLQEKNHSKTQWFQDSSRNYPLIPSSTDPGGTLQLTAGVAAEGQAMGGSMNGDTPDSWMVYFMENPTNPTETWMRTAGTPVSTDETKPYETICGMIENIYVSWMK